MKMKVLNSLLLFFSLLLCCVLTRGQTGSLVGWGRNDYGQLGDGTTKTQQLFPENLLSGVEVGQISGGNQFSAAIIGNIQFFRLDLSDIFIEKGNGSVVAWGYTGNQIGNSSYVESNSPLPIYGLFNITQISAGYSHTLALLGKFFQISDNIFFF